MQPYPPPVPQPEQPPIERATAAPFGHSGRGQPNFLDDVADDLSVWIDQTAEDVARAFAPGRAPFSADLTEEQKLNYYRAQLFNPDGSPNVNGRTAQIQRLGAQGFAAVYKAVTNAWPQLKIPTPPEITVPQGPPPGPSGPPMPPGMPMPPGPPGPPPMPPGMPPGPPGPPLR